MKEHIVPLPGPAYGRAQSLVAQGRFANLADVVAAGIEALEDDAGVADEELRKKVREALNDTRPSVPLEQAMLALKASH